MPVGVKVLLHVCSREMCREAFLEHNRVRITSRRKQVDTFVSELVVRVLQVVNAIPGDLHDDVATISRIPYVWNIAPELDAENSIAEITGPVSLFCSAEHMTKPRRKCPAIAARNRVREQQIDFDFKICVCHFAILPSPSSEAISSDRMPEKSQKESDQPFADTREGGKK